MAIATLTHEADRKRAYVADDPSSHAFQPSPKKVEFTLPSIQLVTPSPRRHIEYPSEHRHRRKSSADKPSRGLQLCRTSMQVPPSPRTFAAPMPSFMTVFDEEATRSELGDLSSHHASDIPKSLPSNNSSNSTTTAQTSFGHMNTHFPTFHKQRDSISTSASESSDNSPTTTVSTLDSSSMTEPSPGPSPETPASAMPLTYTMDESRFQPPVRSQTEPATGHFFEMQRPSTPAKKARNLKNLAVNTTSAYNLGRAILSAPFPAQNPQPERTSAPSSPVFVKPPTPPRRKLGNIGLTIKTPANNTEMARIGVPPTPSIIKPNTLRHFQSSPSLPLMTPSHAPVGGMTLPSLRTRPGPRGFAEVPLEAEEEETEPNFDVPQSQEEKPESYPNGPIRIYESGVDLYYEPSVEVASRYDVIFNVASEVKNPFTVAAEALRSPPIAEPTANKGILAEDTEMAGSPATPKATPITTQMPAPELPTKQPEYIHIPWEHNTDLVPDLHRLVKVIDERVQQGKRVLVHCQCGVSRSATLIVAYGIYKNPEITVQEAYDAVKKRSKWIGPNMNLIMQLQEFRTGLIRNNRRENVYPSQFFTLPRKLSTNLSTGSTMASFDMGSNSVSGQITPRTAPLPPEKEDSSPNRARTSSMGPLTAAPLENRESPFWPPGQRRSWGEGQAADDLDMHRVSIISDTPYIDPKGHVVPMVTVIQQEDNTNELETTAPKTPERVSQDIPSRTKSQKRKTPNFSRVLPLRRDEDGDSPMTDAPPLPSLLSPRNEEFHMLGVSKEPAERVDDDFGLFSPLAAEFPKERPSQPSDTAPFPSIAASSHSVIAAPSKDSLAGFSFFDQQQSLPSEPFSVMSPMNSEFPREFPLRNTDDFSRFQSQSRLTPRKNAPKAIKTKFSSPNLQETIRLQKLQDELASKLPGAVEPKRHMDDLDALMSPRATSFTSNPFHDLLAVKTPSQTQVQPEPQNTPVTPTISTVDPRSPPQQGISPITRNIFDVL